ncbi:MAG: phosphatidate cytidylyltransferase [Chitinophagaceae bacterium]
MNWQTFRTRALTSIVFVVVMSAGLFWNRWSFFLLFTLVHFGCWVEYQKLVQKFNPDYKNIGAFHRWGIMVAGCCGMLFFTNGELVLGKVRLNEVGWYLGLLLAVLVPAAEVLHSRRLLLPKLGYSLAGLLYISVPLALLMDMRNRWVEEDYQLSMTIPLLTIFTLWVNDTMAYVVGSLVGKTPLTPVSPKKTWEGTIGGIILAIIVMCTIAYFTGRLSILHTGIITAIAAISGTYGDLFESKLKRMAGVKDSGQIMPGHGGFLDRFDSLLFAATAVWFYAVIFM